MSIPDHPIIQNCERTGWPDGKEPSYPRCPVCKRECETIYKDKGLDIIGCDQCAKVCDAWGEPECFPHPENPYEDRKEDASWR